jgi:glycopeptide antibiotics resistance protein
MTEQRIFQVYAVIAEYVLLGILAYMGKYRLSGKKILYIFAVGFFVHFSMETTLLLTGVRVLDFFNLIFNSIVEFNTGAPILYLMLYAVVPFIERRMNHEGSSHQ